MAPSEGRIASVNKALAWAAGALLAAGAGMTQLNGLHWEATIGLSIAGLLGVWRFLRQLQWSRRHIQQVLSGYVILALLIAPRAHDYYTTPPVAKTLTLTCHYFSKETNQPEVVVLKGNFFRHFFLGTAFPPTIHHNFANDETYGCLLELTPGKYGTALRQLTFAVFDNPDLGMVTPLEPVQSSKPLLTRWVTVQQLDGHIISHFVTLYGVQKPPIFPAPRMTAKKKGKYPVRWEIQGTAIDVQGQNADLGVIKGKFVLELD